MVRIISVANLKGGVGKTTSAVNIAACWGEAGEKVLLVDLDPQGSASMSFGIKSDGNDLFQALQKTIALPVLHTKANGVDVVPSGPHLAAARQRFTGTIGNELLHRCLKQTHGDWSKVIIDCPPSLGILTMTALWASNHVIIPVEASFLAMGGLTQMMDTISSVGKHHPGLKMGAIIPCRAHPRRRVHQAIMDQLEELFPGKVSPAVRENAALNRSSRTWKAGDPFCFQVQWCGRLSPGRIVALSTFSLKGSPLRLLGPGGIRKASASGNVYNLGIDDLNHNLTPI